MQVKKRMKMKSVSELECFLLHKTTPIKRNKTTPDAVRLCPDITEHNWQHSTESSSRVGRFLVILSFHASISEF